MLRIMLRIGFCFLCLAHRRLHYPPRPLILSRHASRLFDHFGISITHAGKTPCHSNATYSDAEGVKLTDELPERCALRSDAADDSLPHAMTPRVLGFPDRG
ncbi:hypothetical protein GY45DRAFT_699305 [Cubamyces sp. BRFM 1775]|nr:hypothetical protein GY45DRAFT_699305 [Cubamyces sp. BRFM 1775]